MAARPATDNVVAPTPPNPPSPGPAGGHKPPASPRWATAWNGASSPVKRAAPSAAPRPAAGRWTPGVDGQRQPGQRQRRGTRRTRASSMAALAGWPESPGPPARRYSPWLPTTGRDMVEAYVLIQTEVGKAAQVALASRALPASRRRGVTGPYDAIVHAVADDVDSLGKLVVAASRRSRGSPAPYLPGRPPLSRDSRRRRGPSAAAPPGLSLSGQPRCLLPPSSLKRGPAGPKQ